MRWFYLCWYWHPVFEIGVPVLEGGRRVVRGVEVLQLGDGHIALIHQLRPGVVTLIKAFVIVRKIVYATLPRPLLSRVHPDAPAVVDGLG